MHSRGHERGVQGVICTLAQDHKGDRAARGRAPEISCDVTFSCPTQMHSLHGMLEVQLLVQLHGMQLHGMLEV